MKKKRVLVGMSGGVDSSVTAALLKKRGYDVIGITMQLLPNDPDQVSSCCNISTITEAKRVCHQLNIPHYTINSRDTFKKNVMDYFVAEYLSGHTPNPCVECNRSIKFDELRIKAKDLDAEFIATGHYCQKRYNPFTKTYELRKAVDTKKDQSYFLYMVSNPELQTVLFPLGRYLKPQVRQMAQEFGLVTAQKPESQDICFVAGKTYKDVVEELKGDVEIPSGTIVDTSGKVLGTHKGIHTLTIGQRKGLGISAPEPLYVLKIDPRTATVVVGAEHECESEEIELKTFTQVSPKEVVLNQWFQMKSRYQMNPFEAQVTSLNTDNVIVRLKVKQAFVTPGQSGVLYRNNRVVGGGVIVR